MLNDLTITRFPNGVVDRDVNNILSSFGQLDPTKYHIYMEDFDYYAAANWTITDTGVSTHALTDADGGELLLTTAGADNDASFFNKVGESFTFETGKKLFFKALLTLSDATQSDLICGLQITDTTPLAVTDGVYFQKDDGAATIDFEAIKNSTAVTAAAVATLADATEVELAFYWDGIDRIYYGVAGTVLGYITPSTSLPDDEVLTVSFGVQAGEAAAKTLAIDYIFVAKER